MVIVKPVVSHDSNCGWSRLSLTRAAAAKRRLISRAFPLRHIFPRPLYRGRPSRQPPMVCHARLQLRHVQPTSALRRAARPQFALCPPRFLRQKTPMRRSRRTCAQLALRHDDFPGARKILFRHAPCSLRPARRSVVSTLLQPSSGDANMKTSRDPLHAKTRRTPRRGNPGFPYRSPRTLNLSDRRAPFIPFPGIRIRRALRASRELRAPFRRRAPFTAPPGFKPVFFMSAGQPPGTPSSCQLDQELPGRPPTTAAAGGSHLPPRDPEASPPAPSQNHPPQTVTAQCRPLRRHFTGIAFMDVEWHPRQPASPGSVFSTLHDVIKKFSPSAVSVARRRSYDLDPSPLIPVSWSILLFTLPYNRDEGQALSKN
jgi:hypothetical protein